MLILTRRLGDSITIGDNVKLTVLSIKGSQVRIGVEAPKDVCIQRSELSMDKEQKSKDSSSDNSSEK
ncbi:MAG: carbon storage regulator CsrA [Ruminobacter sp.]|nr:carbon storage regulator CsrA [Ruminobacter sp.]